MSKTTHLRRRRLFPETFKRARVKEYETGKFTVNELSELYSIAHKVIYHWIKRYSIYGQGQTILVVEEKSQYKVNQELKKRLEALEAVLGRKQLEIEYLSKIIEFGSREVGADLKKKFDAGSWSGSDKKNNTP